MDNFGHPCLLKDVGYRYYFMCGASLSSCFFALMMESPWSLEAPTVHRHVLPSEKKSFLKFHYNHPHTLSSYPTQVQQDRWRAYYLSAPDHCCKIRRVRKGRIFKHKTRGVRKGGGANFKNQCKNLCFHWFSTAFHEVSHRAGSFCLPPEGQEEVNLVFLVLVVVVLGIISFFFHI